MHNHKNTLESQSVGLGAAVFEISKEIFEKIPQFEYWSGAGNPVHHHYGDYGLAKHTTEVIDLMLASNATLRIGLRHDLVFLAGLFHDIGKVWDYKRTPEFGKCWPHPQQSGVHWSKTDHARTIHHISRSGLVWSKAVDTTGLFKDEHDEVLHAILAHHGRREWGSPIMPKTKLAWLLHLCDGISARMDDCEKLDLAAH